jgi:hypothetical protein
MARAANETFAGKQAFVSGWGQTNRLLTGPFASEAAATAYIAQLRRADVDGAFVWTSPAGQVVDTLAGTAVPEAAKPARTTSSRSGRAARSRAEAADRAPARSARSSRTRSAAAETEAPRSSKSRKSRASAKEAEKATTRTRR